MKPSLWVDTTTSNVERRGGVIETLSRRGGGPVAIGEAGEDRLEHLSRGDAIAADREIEFRFVCRGEAIQRRAERNIGESLAGAGENPLQRRLAEAAEFTFFG